MTPQISYQTVRDFWTSQPPFEHSPNQEGHLFTAAELQAKQGGTVGQNPRLGAKNLCPEAFTHPSLCLLHLSSLKQMQFNEKHHF